jgi:hypothetical protein
MSAEQLRNYIYATSLVFEPLANHVGIIRPQNQNNAVMDQARATMRRIGLGLIEERRSEVIAEMQAGGGKNGIDGDQTVLGRDLLSVLSKSILYP